MIMLVKKESKDQKEINLDVEQGKMWTETVHEEQEGTAKLYQTQYPHSLMCCLRQHFVSSNKKGPR